MNSLTSVFLVAGAVLVGLSADDGLRPADTLPVDWVPEASDPDIDLTPEDEKALIGRYCTRCHNDRRMTGNLSLESYDPVSAVENPEVSEKVIHKLRLGMMPPPGSRRPTGDSLTVLATGLETRIDAAAALNPNPGRRLFQRLNRAEYTASIEELLGLVVDIDAFLPAETLSNNFDNIADVQNMSTTLLEGYLRAAGYVATIAVGDPKATATSATYKVPRTASQLARVEGAPLGTRGGVSVVHNFPADGQYEFQMELLPSPTGYLYGRTSLGETLEVSINGERVAVYELDRWMNEADPNGMRIRTEPISVRAGPQRVTAAFIATFEGPVDDLLTPVEHTAADTQIGEGYGVTTVPHLRDLAVLGPYNVTGVSDNPIRRGIFHCRPTAPGEELACAGEIVEKLARQAYRRDLDADDRSNLMRFYEQGAIEGGFEAGVRTALQAILASPHFVFRLEEAPADVAGGESYRISDVDLASRLSFFLWGGPPDDELVRVAESGTLSETATLETQVDRMLADPKAEAIGTRFGSQWLRLQDLEKLHPDAQLYPYYDATLAASMERETELFFYSIVQDDRSVLDLFTADYTFVDERLARHYGIDGVVGNEFRRVTYPDDTRRGILGHGSILAMTSHANRTSPVLRGKWVMEVILGSPPPPPPPGVPDLEETDAVVDGRILTVREQMEEHRNNPACRSCHVMMDPIGLALENYDVTGVWRIKDHGMPVDPVGELYDGSEIAGPQSLRKALVSRPEPVLRNFTQNLMAYALGRRVEYYDMPTVRAITREAAANDYRISSFIKGVVTSDAFRMSVAENTDQQGQE